MNIAFHSAHVPHTAYLLLGTNQGDRLANLQAAISALPPNVRPVSVSAVYETPPWGFLEQPVFLNQAVRVETYLAPADLLGYLKKLEIELGRKTSFRYGPRSIDIDILLYDNVVLDLPELIIPHPRLHERAFVLVPLADLAPDLIHPRMKKTIRDLLETVDATGIHPFLHN
jgi:2-amino-4-hydroxy-6-hydroxymethyldihydropteridine diphosphokinase